MPNLSRLSLPAYAVCLWLIGFTLVDAGLLMLPLSPTMPEWRYSLGPHVVRYMLSPMMGIFLALVLATVFEHAGVLKAVVIFSGLVSIGLTLFLLIFTVDSFGFRGVERQGLVPAFGMRWLVVFLKLVVSIVVAGAIAVAARGLATGEGIGRKAEPGVVGR